MNNQVQVIQFLFVGILFFISAICINNAQADSIYETNHHIPIIFVPKLDNAINSDDPRIKTIIYINQLNHLAINIYYHDTQGLLLANKLATLLTHNGCIVNQPKYDKNSIDSVYLWES